ncbi:hypothetical protein PHLCEN_2v616 [Hermanssonia centrifuga]|uniref:Uncharacterized protein n=1 Tax=Hermanssonia centrifuga TaxID=98765 RepID=A0A2R6S5G8_9APHY|nr:hypothetical protein PHLCEN_2v616 [Hermanssonia centrifuga]
MQDGSTVSLQRNWYALYCKARIKRAWTDVVRKLKLTQTPRNTDGVVFGKEGVATWRRENVTCTEY